MRHSDGLYIYQDTLSCSQVKTYLSHNLKGKLLIFFIIIIRIIINSLIISSVSNGPPYCFCTVYSYFFQILFARFLGNFSTDLNIFFHRWLNVIWILYVFWNVCCHFRFRFTADLVIFYDLFWSKLISISIRDQKWRILVYIALCYGIKHN